MIRKTIQKPHRTIQKPHRNHTEPHRNHTETTQKPQDPMKTGLIDVERDIIEQIKIDPSVSIKEMAQKTGWTEWQIRYHLDKLKTSGVLRRDGSQKSGKWLLQDI